MARIRSIKPDFWADEKLAPLAPLTRLVFLGLLSIADDAGRLVDNVKLIDGQLFPETEDSSREAIEALASLGRVVRYRSESGQRLIQVANWTKHQRVDNPSPRVLPGPVAQVPAPPKDKPRSRKRGEKVASPSRDPNETLADDRDRDRDRDGDEEKDIRVIDFESTWSVYPKRSGANPRRDAEKAYNARLAEGIEPARMLAGLERYVAHCRATGRIGGEYVMQGSRFFGPSRLFDEDFGLPVPETGDEDAEAIAAVRALDAQIIADREWLATRAPQ